MIQLYPDQLELKRKVYAAWAAGAQNVCMQSSTGSGKTITFCNILAEHDGKSGVIAHRSELVGQASLVLARQGIRHKIIGSESMLRAIIANHIADTGKNWVSSGAHTFVASVDTLIRMDHAKWMDDISLLIQDEAHHVLRENKWGTAAAMFKHARGLYPTATPLRADGKGLGRYADGIMDALVLGLPMRELINLHRLSDYVISCPESDVDYSEVTITASGELSMPKLRDAVHKSKRIVGDVVAAYKQWAEGTLGVTFAVDVEIATEIMLAYRKGGVPAELITANTPEQVRAGIMRRFRKREVLQLISVDILGEGVDVPAIETVSFARKTNSFGLYSQQFGRGLRVMEGKSNARIIDHVGNVAHHNLPDTPKLWTLDRAEKRSRSTIVDDAIPLRICLNPMCIKPFIRVLDTCPYCKTKVVPRGRASPEQVEGNMIELDLEVLKRMRGEIAKVDAPMPFIPNGVTPMVAQSIKKNHKARQDAQRYLRDAMELWGGYHKQLGREDSEIQMRFYRMFGIDVLTAQALGRTEAEDLYLRISAQLIVDGVVKAA